MFLGSQICTKASSQSFISTLRTWMCPILLVTVYWLLNKAMIHPVQVPWWDVSQWLPRSIILLKSSPRPKIMSPRPINRKIFYPGHIEVLSPVIFGKLLLPTEFEYFISVLGLRTSSSTWLLRFCIVSAVMDSWYLACLTHLNWTRFFGNILAP